MMIVARRIRSAVNGARYSPLRIAQQLGISLEYLNCITSGRTAVSAFVAVRLERALGVDAHKLMVDQALDELRSARNEYEREEDLDRVRV